MTDQPAAASNHDQFIAARDRAVDLKQTIHRFEDGCDNALTWPKPGDDLEDAGRLFAAVDDLLQATRDLHSSLSTRLGRLMMQSRISTLAVVGARPIARDSDTKRSEWRHAELRKAVVTRLRARLHSTADGVALPEQLVDAATGEAVDTAELVDSIADWMLEQVGGAYGEDGKQAGGVYRLAGDNARMTALKDLGLDPDDYCTKGDTVYRAKQARANR